MQDSQSILTSLKVISDENEWKMNECIKCSLCERPVFERGYNWRARQKEEKNDEGLSKPLDSGLETDLCDRVGKRTGKERERQICDVIDAHRHTEMGKIKDLLVVYKLPPQLEVFMPNQVFLDRL